MFPFVLDVHYAEEAFLPRDWDLGASRVTLEYGLKRLGEPCQYDEIYHIDEMEASA